MIRKSTKSASELNKTNLPQGGEQRTMKKQISTILAGSLLLASILPAMAFAAEPTTQEKFDALKANGVMSTANFDQAMTRAEFAVVISRLFKLAPAPAAYSDVPATHWAAGAIGAVSALGIMQGNAGKYNPAGSVTIEQVAKVLATAKQFSPLDTPVAGKVSAWAKGYVAAAIASGYIPTSNDYTAKATRGALVEAAYKVWQSLTQVATSTPAPTAAPTETPAPTATATLAPTATPAPTATAAPSAAPIAATVSVKSTKVIAVAFSGAVDKTKVTFEVKSGSVIYKPAVAFADDLKSATLTAASFFTKDQDYTVTVKGLGADQSSTVKVASEVATTLALKTSIIADGSIQAIEFVTNDQYGAALGSQPAQSDYTFTFYDAKGAKQTLTAPNKFDFATAKVGDKYTAYVFSKTSSLYAQITVELKAAPALGSFAIVAPVYKNTSDDKVATRFDAATAYAYVAIAATEKNDGSALAATSVAGGVVTIAGTAINVYSTDTTVVDPAANITSVDSGKALKITTKKAGSAKLTFIYNDKIVTLDVKSEAPATLKSFNLVAPSAGYANSDLAFTYTAADQFGTEIKAADVNGKNNNYVDFANTLVRYSDADGGNIGNGLAFDAVTGAVKISKTFLTKAGTITVTPKIDGKYASTITIKINAASIATTLVKVDGLVSNYVVNGQYTLAAEKVIVRDQYGNESNLKDLGLTAQLFFDTDANAKYAVTGVGITEANSTPLNEANPVTFTGKDSVTSKVNIKVGNIVDEINLTTLDADKVSSYAIAAVPTLYASITNNAVSPWAKDLTVTGKAADGSVVAIPANQQFIVVSGNTSVVGVKTTVGNPQVLTVFGLSAGSTTVTVKLNGKDVASTTVTTSKEDKKLTTVGFAADKYTVAITGAYPNQTWNTLDLGTVLSKKDQYGVTIVTNGAYSISDTTVATIDQSGFITAVGEGTVTVAYVADSGLTATTTVVVPAKNVAP